MVKKNNEKKMKNHSMHEGGSENSNMRKTIIKEPSKLTSPSKRLRTISKKKWSVSFTFIYIICINNNKIINSRSYSPTWGNHHFNAKLPPTSSPFLMKNCSSNSPPTVKASKNINSCMKKGRRAPSMKKKPSIQLWIKKPINLDPYPYKK